MKVEVCPLYDCCVNKKRLEHCSLCDEFPCETFVGLRDPSLNEEEAEEAWSKRPLAGFEFEDVMGCCQFLGISWSSIDDDETGSEFKARIEEKMKMLFGDDVKCGTHEEAWRDG